MIPTTKTATNQMLRTSQKVWTSIFMIIAVLSLGFYIVERDQYGIVVDVIFLIVGALLQIGDWKTIYQLYIPSALFWFSSIVLSGANVVAKFFVAVKIWLMDKQTFEAIYHEEIDDLKPNPRAGWLIANLGLSMLYLICAIISFYMFTRVVKACQYVYYMKKQLEQPKKKEAPKEFV
ncbi:hypothetical protein M3Y97_01095900 [Aphelenchoides bicaudatus]|nr:hypothetical protein M3Y97_01095900 [Aphelenchoides bicaudatus]